MLILNSAKLLNVKILKKTRIQKIKIGGANDERMRLYIPKKS